MIVCKHQLSRDRARLVELMQDLNFGQIEGLHIRCGQPVFNPRPTVIREHKFRGENGPRPELTASGFPLKAKVVELFECIQKLHGGVIDVLEVQRGLPFRMAVTEEAA